MTQVNFGSINNKLNHLENIKSDMRNSLVNKGEVITTGTPFQNYVETIDKLTNTYGATVNSDSIWGENNYAWVNNEKVYGTMQNGHTNSVEDVIYKMGIYENYPSVMLKPLQDDSWGPGKYIGGMKHLPILDFSGMNRISKSGISDGDYITYNMKTIAGIENTTLVTNMRAFFSNGYNLQYLNISNIDTANVTDFSGIFGYGTGNLLCINGIDALNTDSASNMAYMFYRCGNRGGTSLLASSYVVNLNCTNANNMVYMFSESILPVVNLSLIRRSAGNIANVEYMFRYAHINSLNLTQFNFRNINSTNYMFVRIQFGIVNW